MQHVCNIVGFRRKLSLQVGVLFLNCNIRENGPAVVLMWCDGSPTHRVQVVKCFELGDHGHRDMKVSLRSISGQVPDVYHHHAYLCQ